MAEKGGFEPPLGYYPKHAFQACDLNRSSTSPKGAQNIPERPLPQSEMVLPLAHGSEYAQFTDTTLAGVGQAALLQGADDFRLGAAQEGVGGFFQRDGGGQCDLVRRAQLLGGGDALFHGGVIRFAGQRKTQVGGGVFVGAIYAGCIGQLCKALQGMVELR